jgi:uncharacterized repeat protein (TIGR01451 family)
MSAMKNSIRFGMQAGRARPRRSALVLLATFAPVLTAVLTPAALAVTQQPQWTVTAVSEPTNFAPTPGSKGVYSVQVENTGGVASDGSTIAVSDVLPSGLKATATASGKDFATGEEMSCSALSCTYAGVVVPEDYLTLTIPVEVLAGAPSSVTNSVSVSGGGASEASRETPTTLSATPAGFGLAPGSVATTLSTTQAGAHPDVTVSAAFDADSGGLLAGDPKETSAELPPGFVGDLADTPKCPITDFSRMAVLFEPQTCRLSTQVGTMLLVLNVGFVKFQVRVPVYNLTTNPGEIAKLGFEAVEFGVQGTVSLTPGDYRVRTTFQGIKQNEAQFDSFSLTVWGVPADSSHDAMRGRLCLNAGNCSFANTETAFVEGVSGQASTSPAIPYLTSPTQCTATPLQVTVAAASWEEPDQQASVSSDMGPLVGCNLLEFAPAIAAAPDTTRADSPAGFTFELKMGQEGLVNPEVLSSADIEDTTVALPAGVVVNPGQANGLGACPLAQDGVDVEGPPSCPSDSKVGQVEIATPILKQKLIGNVYLLQSNPPDLKLLVAPEDAADGIYVKFVGAVHLDETTGQLLTTFEKTPELPFDDLKLSFSGGPQAALATPAECGTYTTDATFAPWSGQGDALTSSAFAIEAGPGGSACSSPLPFAPELIAGATTDQAGGFTDFSMLLRRADGQQRIQSLQFKVPEGLLGMISKVALCGEPQAEQGTCPAASQIGHTVVEAGPGPYPLVIPQPGAPPAPIYLTGGYRGAPYGLSIVVPLVVGPFTLETQIVRARIEVDPHTAQLTVTTDPFPTIIDGVPADLRSIDAVIDKPGFMFNPTDCAPMAFGGAATSTAGATAAISSHFQVGSCQALKFAPNFKVATQGKTSRADGASLDAKIVYPSGALGDNQASSQSNIKLVKVELPKQLPSRLTTLQKACTAQVFESDPANCPQASVVGHASAVTPVLPVALEGPAYFVSHGGQAFPSLIVVLQGYGTTVDLVGSTFISKAGITSSTFKQVPDVPISSFELALPEGPYSALAANGNLCKAKSLTMPTEFIAQNGAEIHQQTRIAITGCPKAKKAAKQKQGRSKRTGKAKQGKKK